MRIKIIAPLLLGILTAFAFGFGVHVLAPTQDVQNAVGSFANPFLSIQLALTPSSGNCLTTDGTNNSWSTCASGSGGSGNSNMSYDASGNYVYPATTTSSVKAASYTATSSATSTLPNLTTTNLAVTGKLYGGASPGTIGQVLQSTGAAVQWVATSSLGFLAAAISDFVSTVRTSISDSVPGLTYNNSTGDLSLDSGSVISSTTREASQDTAATLAHAAVTMSGTATYITLSGQDIVRGTVDISSHTNLTADGTEIVLTNDALSLGNLLTFTNGTSSTVFQTALLGVGTDYASDITGSGLNITNSALTCITASVSVFGCLTATDWDIFNKKVSTSSIDTVAELETLTSVNLIVSTEIDTIGEIETLAAGVNIIVATEIDTSAELLAIQTDEVGTGANVFGNNSNLSGTTVINALTATSGTSSILAVTTTLTHPYGASPTLGPNGSTWIDSTTNQFDYVSGGVTKVLGNGNLYASFTYSTTTAWTGTTTLPLGPAPLAETWSAIACFTNLGTVNIDVGDGTNFTNATTTKALNPTPVHTLSSNNTFTSGETRYIRMGTPVSAPTSLSCTVTKTITAD